MRAGLDGLLRGLGISTPTGPRGPARRTLVALLAVYALAFAIFFPQVATNDDEAIYIRQAAAVLDGRATLERIDPMVGRPVVQYTSSYPPGTAIAMAPFVAALGWRGAFVLPCLSLLFAVGLTALWIRDARGSPLFALLILGFPPALVMGRVAMSDVPSAAVAALGLWLFFRGIDRKPRWWLASGFVAGASMIVRVSNPLIFVPLFAGTLLRREKKCWALIVGGLAGVALRALGMQLYFGSAVFERSAYYFAPLTIDERLPYYLLGLMIFVPGGLLLSLLYRGRRWPEVTATVVLFFVFFLLQRFSTFGTGDLKRIVLALRYFIPLLPLLAFAMAESTPRWWAVALARLPEAMRPRVARAGAVLVGAWLAGLAVAVIGVHAFFAIWSATQAELRGELDRHVSDDAVLVTNTVGTRKFLREADRKFLTVDRDRVRAVDVRRMAARYGDVFIALLDRSDSGFWLADQERTRIFLAELDPAPELILDRSVTATDRLRIWRVRSGSAGP